MILIHFGNFLLHLRNKLLAISLLSVGVIQILIRQSGIMLGLPHLVQ